jgi:hypothetical protein
MLIHEQDSYVRRAGGVPVALKRIAVEQVNKSFLYNSQA